MSSHREAPEVSKDPVIANTDLYHIHARCEPHRHGPGGESASVTGGQVTHTHWPD